jgi:hypothetical protein
MVWLLEGSSSMVASGNGFSNMTDFIAQFALLQDFSLENTRMGYVVFAGPFDPEPDPNFKTILAYLNITDPIASDSALFLDDVATLNAVGGTTNTAGAIDFVRTELLRPEDKRPGSHRIVVLATDGDPTDGDGTATEETRLLAEAATLNLRAEDDVIFVFLRFTEHLVSYHPDYMVTSANYIYDSTFQCHQLLCAATNLFLTATYV